MKPLILSLAVFLLAACPAPQAADKASSPAENPAMPNDTVSIPQMRANAEARLAAYDYHNAAYWAYELKRRGEPLPPHLQQVLDEEQFVPDQPVSTASTYYLRPERVAELTAKAENDDRRAAERLYWFYLFVGPEPGKNDPQAAEYWRKKAGIEE